MGAENRVTTRGWREDAPWLHAHLLLQNILSEMYSFIPFGSLSVRDTHINASEALSQVQAAYFPEMERVEFLLSPENMAAFDIIAGYSIPRFFYEDEQGILFHRWASQHPEYSHVSHDIELRSVGHPFSTLITVCGVTGEIRIF